MLARRVLHEKSLHGCLSLQARISVHWRTVPPAESSLLIVDSNVVCGLPFVIHSFTYHCPNLAIRGVTVLRSLKHLTGFFDLCGNPLAAPSCNYGVSGVCRGTVKGVPFAIRRPV